MSLVELGRFVEATEYETDMIRLAEPTYHAFSIGMAYRAAGLLHLLKRNFTTACSLIGRGIAAFKSGNVLLQLPWAVAASAWAAGLGSPADSAGPYDEDDLLAI